MLNSFSKKLNMQNTFSKKSILARPFSTNGKLYTDKPSDRCYSSEGSTPKGNSSPQSSGSSTPNAGNSSPQSSGSTTPNAADWQDALVIRQKLNYLEDNKVLSRINRGEEVSASDRQIVNDIKEEFSSSFDDVSTKRGFKRVRRQNDAEIYDFLEPSSEKINVKINPDSYSESMSTNTNKQKKEELSEKPSEFEDCESLDRENPYTESSKKNKGKEKAIESEGSPDLYTASPNIKPVKQDKETETNKIADNSYDKSTGSNEKPDSGNNSSNTIYKVTYGNTSGMALIQNNKSIFQSILFGNNIESKGKLEKFLYGNNVDSHESAIDFVIDIQNTEMPDIYESDGE
jgi:hypothetical protein